MLGTLEIVLIIITIVIIVCIAVFRRSIYFLVISTALGAIFSHRKDGGADDEAAINFDAVTDYTPIGAGVFGTVYKVNYAGRQYALKREKILAEDAQKTPRQITAYNTLKTLPCADNFVKIYGWRVYKCDFANTPPPAVANRIAYDPWLAKAVASLQKSEYCLDTLMELGGSPLGKYLEQCISMTSGGTNMAKNYNIIKQLLQIVKCTREHDILIGDLHAGNILLNEDQQVKVIDYGEIYTLSEIAALPDEGTRNFMNARFEYNDDLFGIIAECMYGQHTFETYLSKLKKFPDPAEMVTWYKSRGKWTEIERHLQNIFRESSLLSTIDKGPYHEIGKQIDFVGGIVDPAGATEFWQQYVPEFKDPGTLIPQDDLVFMLDNYWDMDALITRFTAQT